MDLKIVDLAISAGMNAVRAMVGASERGDPVLVGTTDQILKVSMSLRAAARQDLAMNGIQETAEGDILVLDSSLSPYLAAQRAEMRWLSMVDANYEYLSTFAWLQSTNSEEALKNLREFNARMPELEGADKALIAAYNSAFEQAHPPAPPGPGPFGSTPGEPAYFAAAMDRLNAKLDAIFVAVKTGAGGGIPPVPTPIEGSVAGVIQTRLWHQTSQDYRYGALGEPARRLNEWQVDILMRPLQTGKMLTLSPGLPAGHLTRNADNTFWISIGKSALGGAPISVVLSDTDVSGTRVVQRFNV